MFVKKYKIGDENGQMDKKLKQNKIVTSITTPMNKGLPIRVKMRLNLSN